jgi:tetraacyldisaccharide 4'-kinase
MDIVDLRAVKPPDELSPALRTALMPLLFPLSGIYGTVMRIRRAIPADRTDVGIPVVSVGSLAVGGTGKTPLCIRIADRFARAGRAVFILSRGYRRKGGPSPMVVSDGRDLLANIEQAGDEPYMMARHLPNVGVVVGQNRLSSAVEARDSLGADMLVLDDGFQERNLHRAAEVLCFGAATISRNNAPLPLGTLREGWSAVGPGHLVMVRLERRDLRPSQEELEHLGEAQVFYWVYAEPRVVDVKFREVEADELNKHRFLLVSGIARPAAFEAFCCQTKAEIAASIRYQDHHWYNARDAGFITVEMQTYKADRIITTEKDIWKFPDRLREISFIVEAQIDFLDADSFWEALDRAIGEAI